MFNDAKKELERLEAELLAEEESPEAPPEEDPLEAEDSEELPDGEAPVVYSNYSNQYGRALRNYASGYRAYNTDRTDRDPEEFSEEILRPKKSRGILGPAVVALLLLAAIAAVLFWALWRMGGFQ